MSSNKLGNLDVIVEEDANDCSSAEPYSLVNKLAHSDLELVRFSYHL